MITLFLKKAKITNNAKFQNSGTEWYVPQNTSSMEQQKIESQQIIKKIPKGFQYIERSFL